MDIQKETNEKDTQPFYIKATIILFGLVMLFFVLHILASILVPLAFACLLAILLNPLNKKLQRKLPRGLATFCSLLVAIAAVTGILYFLSLQIASFSETIPALKAKSLVIATQLQQWIFLHFGIAINNQVAMIKNALEGSESYLGQTLNTLLGVTSFLVLIPVYVFFLLFYKPLILDFLFEVFSEKNSMRVAEILSETKAAVQHYVIGLLIEAFIVSSLNSLALLALGVRSAILIGFIGGIVNVIPYLGGIVAIALPLLMVTVTNVGYSTHVAIIVCYVIIQLIDNNILMTKIVSSKVKINPLISIIVVLMGGALWGFSGMFLSIPIIGIVKIIFDRVDGLKPWGHLMGNKIPEIHAGVKYQARWQRIFERRKK